MMGPYNIIGGNESAIGTSRAEWTPRVASYAQATKLNG